MTLKQLQDLTKHYYDWVTVSEVQHESPVLAALGTKCRCGAEYAVSILTEHMPAPYAEIGEDGSTSEVIEVKKYTRVACVNPFCWVKQAYSLYHFISSLGFSGIGERTCLNLVYELHDKFEYSSFLSAFLLTENEVFPVLKEHMTGVFMSIKSALYNTRWKMTDIVPALGIPGLGRRSRLFEVVGNPVDLLGYLLKPESFQRLLYLMGTNDEGFKAQFELHKVDILLLYTKVAPNFLQKARRTMYIAITGSVSVDGTHYSRSEFKDLCTSFKDENGRQYYDIIETKAKSKIEYVVADGPSNSEKYILGEQMNILITAQEFVDLLRDSLPKPKEDEKSIKELTL